MCIILSNNESVILNCKIDSKKFVISYKNNELINCATCDDDILNELNAKYFVKNNKELTQKNIEAYFKNNGGSCIKN